MSLERFWEKVKETTPEALSRMSLDQLHEYYDYFAQANRDVGGAADIRAAKERIDLLQRAIEHKRLSEQNDQQHKETLTQGDTILLWTKRAVFAAVAVPILVVLIAEIPFSRLLPSKASPASPASSPQTIPTDVLKELPPAREPVLAVPLESPTPESTSTPTATPIKLPPPAP